MLVIDEQLLDELSEKARKSPRLRAPYDLRNGENDDSQRMLNAIEPGTIVPIHRHRGTSETCICVRGHFEELIFDDNGTLAKTLDMQKGSMVNIEAGEWHSLHCLEKGTTLLECKNGKWEPLADDDIMKIE